MVRWSRAYLDATKNEDYWMGDESHTQNANGKIYSKMRWWTFLCYIIVSLGFNLAALNKKIGSSEDSELVLEKRKIMILSKTWIGTCWITLWPRKNSKHPWFDILKTRVLFYYKRSTACLAQLTRDAISSLCDVQGLGLSHS